MTTNTTAGTGGGQRLGPDPAVGPLLRAHRAGRIHLTPASPRRGHRLLGGLVSGVIEQFLGPSGEMS